MKIKYALSAISLLFAATSCNLDVKMYDGIMGEDLQPQNLEELSRGSYRMLKNENGIIDNGYRFWTYGADDISWNGTSSDEAFYFYDYSRSIGSTRTDYAWELAYRTIGNCNMAIEIAQGFGDSRGLAETVIMGENHYIRALCYFLLVNEFAQPYSNNPTQNPGLPLKLNSNPDDLPQSRSTVAEVYEQIEKDLKDAITYMTLPAGETPKNSCYATKEAAEALLARVYLFMERWDDAYKMADNVIQSGRFELETGERYATYSQHTPETNKETIFAVRMTIDKDKDNEGAPGGMYINIDNKGWEEMFPSSRYLELLELYLKEDGMPQDLRSRFITKRYVEDGTDDYTVYGYPNKEYKNWSFAYTVKQEKTANYVYKQLSVTKQPDGTYTIDNDADQFQSATIQSEPYNLGIRYYVKAADGSKYIGRLEPTVFDAKTKGNKSSNYLVYAINKCSYQEERAQLWSPIISRLAEMYLTRAEASAEKGNIQAALDDVNVIRRRAGIPEWTIANMATAENGNAKDIKKIVEEERMLELAWEGHRRFDVYRHRQTMDRKYPGGHTLSVGDKFLEIPYNSPSVCEFIPRAQYDAYPYKLEQNP